MEDAAVNSIGVWHGEHVRISRLLDFLGRQIIVPQVCRHPNCEMLRRVVRYLRAIMDYTYSFACPS